MNFHKKLKKTIANCFVQVHTNNDVLLITLWEVDED